MAKIKHSFLIRVDATFFEYPSGNKNKKAISFIEKYTRDILRYENSVPIYIEKDENGSAIEDVANIKATLFKGWR